MYARYIPPPRAKDSEGGERDVAASKSSTSVTVKTKSSTTPYAPYARYVPPPKPNSSKSVVMQRPKKIVFNNDDSPEPKPKKRKVDEAADDGPINSREAKKRKKEKHMEKEPGLKSAAFKNQQDGSEEDRARGNDSKGPLEKEAPKEKKPRKDKRLRGEDSPDIVESTAELFEDPQQGEKPSAQERLPGDIRKKQLKKDRRRAGAHSSLVGANAGPEQTEMPLVDSDLIKADTAKTGKETKKKKKPGEHASAEVEGDDDYARKPERHKSLLLKKEKSLKQSGKVAKNQDGTILAEPDQGDQPSEILKEPEELHGLEPLPLPAPTPLDTSKPTYETLPPWLASPIRVSPETMASFTDLGISPESTAVLEAKGYRNAFAVQVAAIPFLLPSPGRQGDLAISAATGSGKTLAYALPMVKDLSHSTVTRLRAIVIVPTRELVKQAQEMCEVCAAAFAPGGGRRVQIGISMGSQSFKQEQAALVEDIQRYDPAGYQKHLEKHARLLGGDDSDSEADFGPFRAVTKPLPDHVVERQSRVDILICTPGRLVEHLSHTPGFTLDYVRWLVVDEADKLLAQSFQQWLDVVMGKLSVEKPGARDFPGSNKTGVRKVVLSATMTRELSLLGALKLRRPQFIVLEGAKTEGQDAKAGSGEHTLPGLLRESAVKVRDPNLKPLYLIELLDSPHLGSANEESVAADGKEVEGMVDLGDNISGSLSAPEASGSESDESGGRAEPAGKKPSQRASVLIFTRSNESALRLSRLLSILSPELERLIGTLTSTARTSQRQKTLRAFMARKLRILVASDLVARGIDLPNLDNVINYDMPISVASYVHRVGRTARAGLAGHAWTLVANNEAAWFWREIGGEGKGATGTVKRSGKIGRVRIGGGEEGGGKFSEERVQEYENALAQLGREASEMRRKGRA